MAVLTDPKEHKMTENIHALWFEYNNAKNKIQEALGRTANIVGEYTEKLVADAYGGELLPTSHKSADVILPDKRTIQVKARITNPGEVTELSAIRSWDFDILVVLLFEKSGKLFWAGELTPESAKEISRFYKHTNAYNIFTEARLFDARNSKNVTSLFPAEIIFTEEWSSDFPFAHTTGDSPSSTPIAQPETPGLADCTKPERIALIAKMKNKDFAISSIKLLAEEGLTPEADAEMLLDPDICYLKFTASNKAVLQDATGLNDNEIDEASRDDNGKQRYYKVRIHIGQKDYIVMNDWYGKGETTGRNNRGPFLNWLSGRLKE